MWEVKGNKEVIQGWKDRSGRTGEVVTGQITDYKND